MEAVAVIALFTLHDLLLPLTFRKQLVQLSREKKECLLTGIRVCVTALLNRCQETEPGF